MTTQPQYVPTELLARHHELQRRVAEAERQLKQRGPAGSGSGSYNDIYEELFVQNEEYLAMAGSYWVLRRVQELYRALFLDLTAHWPSDLRDAIERNLEAGPPF